MWRDRNAKRTPGPLKPRTPDDCPACRAAQPIRSPASTTPKPYSQVKSPRGHKKRLPTIGFGCPNPDCLYYGITDDQVHALVGYDGHGRHEYIQDLKCQARQTKFSVRYGTVLYRLKTPARRVGEVLSALAEGLSVGAAVRVFWHGEFTVRTWLTRAGLHATSLHERLFGNLKLPHVQLDELGTKTRQGADALWVWFAMDDYTKIIAVLKVGPRTQSIAHAVVHTLVNALAPDCEKEVPVLECFVVLGALAASASRIRLGQLVAGIPYRNPALLAKMCGTLDVISHGRCMVGLGAAWHHGEFTAYGWPFPPVPERMERLEEAVQIVDRMLTQRPANFTGKHYTIQNAYNDPMPVQKPRPPIMIGGDGERVTLTLVAKYADYPNVFGDPATVARKFDVLRRHCEAVGRPFEALTLCNHVSVLIARDEAELASKQAKYPGFDGIAGTPPVVISHLKEYAAVGSRYVTFTLPDGQDIAPIRLLGEAVVPDVASL